VEINFDNPKRSTAFKSSSTSASSQSVAHSTIPVDCDALLQELYKVRPTAAVFRVLPGFALPNIPTSHEPEPNLPPLLTALYDAKYACYSGAELVELCEETFTHLSISTEESKFLERCTRQQSNSCLWYNYRVGRITASKFHTVAKCTERSYPTSLVKSVMQYSAPSPNVPALRWGHEKEETAIADYTNTMARSHTNFKLERCGLIVNPKYPHLGASPDGLTSCDCCGNGLLEVKCPFKYRDTDPKLAREKDFCLQPGPGGALHLSKTHAYYYQVQGQLAMAERSHCDFVCWSPQGVFIEQVLGDPDFFVSLRPKLDYFFVKYILPELLTKRLAIGETPVPLTMEGPSSSTQLYCFCQQEEFGNMIQCDSPECPYDWFHFPCVGMEQAPEGNWYCPDCMKCGCV